MKFDQLPTDLRNWFRDMIGRRTSREDLVRALLAAGYQKRMAEDAVSAAVAAIPAPAPVPEATPMPAPAVAESTSSSGVALDARSFSEQLARMPNAFATSDRQVSMLFALAAPRVILFGDLLSANECDQLIELSRGKLARSNVVNAATGSYDVHPHRTSAGTHFARGENELIRRIEARISELVELPVECGEPLQILHYQPGGEYRPHFDYFDPALPGNEAVLKHGGQRIATLVMYLNDVEAGGSTVFPEVGLDVLPRRGNAVYFAYATEDGQLDKRSLHGGSPVGAGEKWIATKWFRQRAYGGPGA
ncbi:MAG: 2OG-Fe(II) oxygenase [Betaproteobacteria bacterium]